MVARGTRLLPKVPGDPKCIDIRSLPPRDFITRLVQLPMMTSTQRHCEFVADLEANRARLRKTQMVRITWLASTNETCLVRHELQVSFVPQSFGFGDRECAFVNFDRRRDEGGAALIFGFD